MGILLAFAAAQGVARNPVPSEYLDERTGATIIVAAEPWVFALERSTLAANARDYISLTAVEVDRSGHLQVYLIGYVWTTIDSRSRVARSDLATTPLDLFADGRLILLKPQARFPDDFLDDRRLRPETSGRPQRAAYLVSCDILRYLASSRHASISFHEAADQDVDAQDDERETYESWSDGRPALGAFLEHINP